MIKTNIKDTLGYFQSGKKISKKNDLASYIKSILSEVKKFGYAYANDTVTIELELRKEKNITVERLGDCLLVKRKK